MKLFIILSALVTFSASGALAKETKNCACKCVTKTDDDKYENTHGQGKDREAAGIDLKKKLGKKKCELTPVCEGSC